MKNKNSQFLKLILPALILLVYSSGILFLSPPVARADVKEQNLTASINGLRIQNRLSPLQENEKLNRAARARAEDMFKRQYFAHQSPKGQTFIDELLKEEYYFESAGENLAQDFRAEDKLLETWLNSPAHKQNIFNPEFEETGIAKVEGIIDGQQTILVVQIFAKPSTQKNDTFIFINNTKKQNNVLGAYISPNFGRQWKIFDWLLLGSIVVGAACCLRKTFKHY
ncbi:MAG: CAP domain-containing protein [Patescibacteria group bacterium]|nr:CAP domain-containing protein [Patescibacteria group bacterium]MDD5490357.1 CAP domain-containing protein [Patescibacteria group bacterium]